MISKVYVIVEWKLNQQAIADTLCINISKPEVMCHGSCVLNDRLQLVDEKNDRPISEIVKEYKLQPFICTELLKLSDNGVTDEYKIRTLLFYQENYSHLHQSIIFTPPDNIILS